jgi:hypothetical protein
MTIPQANAPLIRPFSGGLDHDDKLSGVSVELGDEIRLR